MPVVLGFFTSFSFLKFMQVQSSRPGLWTSFIYTFIFKTKGVFGRWSSTLRISWKKWILLFLLPLCLNIYVSSLMYEIFIFITMWFVHLGIHFTSSWAWGWILLHHQDKVNWFLLARFFNIPKLRTIILSSLMIILFSDFSSNVMDC